MDSAMAAIKRAVQNTSVPLQDMQKTMINNEGETKVDGDQVKLSVTELFPWIPEFKKKCRSMYTDRSMASLIELMQFYARNVSISVNECYTKPLRAAKLKDSISETLLLFLYIYRELPEDHDRYIYLNNMSDLLAMYIDMELKASKKSKEDHGKICARLASSLYVYLEHSTEHLLDTFIKIQFMCRSYHCILDPILTKVIKNIPVHPESNIMYIRYLLIYRLWRKINSDIAVKNQITATAVASLGSPPPTFPQSLSEDILPKVPKSQPNSTKLLLQHKFDIRRSCELFIQFCRKSRKITSQKIEEDVVLLPHSTAQIKSQMLEDDTLCKNVEAIVSSNVSLLASDENRKNNPAFLLNTFKSLNLSECNNKSLSPFPNNNINSHGASTLAKSNKVLARKPPRKSQEIIVIDLTSDVALEKCIKTRKTYKPAWLDEIKKRIALKKTKTSSKTKIPSDKRIDNTIPLENEVISEHRLPDLCNTQIASAEDITKDTLHICSTSDNKISADTIKVLQSDETSVLAAHTSISNTASKTRISFMDSQEDTCKDIVCSSDSTIKSISDTDSSIKSVLENSNVIKRLETKISARATNNEYGRFNQQTVIKRLIENDAFLTNALTEKIESVKKICDSKTEMQKSVDNVVKCTLYNSKDEGSLCCVNSNPCITCKNTLTQAVFSPITSECDNFTIKQTNNTMMSNTSVNRTCDTVTSPRKLNTESSYTNLSDNIKNTNTIETTVVMDSTKALTAINSVNQDTNQIDVFTEYVSHREISKVSKESPSVQHSFSQDILNDINHGQETSESDTSRNSAEIIKHMGKCPSTALESTELQEIQTVNKSLVSMEISRDVYKIGLHPNESQQCNVKNMEIDENINSYEKTVLIQFTTDNTKTINDQATTNIDDLPSDSISHNINKKDFSAVFDQLNSQEPSKLSKKVYGKQYKLLQGHHTEIKAKNKYIVHETELQENIDGLSLLASVSQNIPHLKAQRESKSDRIKVKDYASLKNTSINHLVDEEADTNDSLNTVSQLYGNPTTDIINRIVGIYPEDALDKVALQVEVTSVNVSPDDENELSNPMPHIIEHMTNYDADALSNGLTLMENSIAPTAENTNVILNGETVVLLQKSPNSNLYIINKAVENGRDHSDDETNRIREKSWINPAEDCTPFEVINAADHVPLNGDLLQYKKDISSQENKFSLGRNKGIKVEPEEEDNVINITDTKTYVKKAPLSADMLVTSQQIYQDPNMTMNKSIDKRKSLSKPNLTYRQNIKQEFNNITNHISANCGIQGCTVLHSHPHEVVESQHTGHIPVTHPNTLPQIYGSCPVTADLCVPYHKHCTSVSCSLQINTTTPLHSHTKSANSCGRSHCSCLNCTYDIVTHCRQCIHPATDTHVSCIESNSYFLPTHSPVQTSTVQEHDRTKSESVIGKVYEDQLLCKIEHNLLQTNSLETINVKREPEKLFKKDIDNKLPLKKRLKAHAMMSMTYEERPIKAEKVDNYPGIPMMSIAALEALDNTQKHTAQIVKPMFELASTKKDDTHSNYHFNTNFVRRDYYKDLHISNNHLNLTKDAMRKHDRQFKSANNQLANVPVCQESCLERTFKTPAQRKEITVSNVTSSKRFIAESIEQESSYKKAKKTQLPIRQTRSSKRNIPKLIEEARQRFREIRKPA